MLGGEGGEELQCQVSGQWHASYSHLSPMTMQPSHTSALRQCSPLLIPASILTATDLGAPSPPPHTVGTANPPWIKLTKQEIIVYMWMVHGPKLGVRLIRELLSGLIQKPSAAYSIGPKSGCGLYAS